MIFFCCFFSDLAVAVSQTFLRIHVEYFTMVRQDTLADKEVQMSEELRAALNQYLVMRKDRPARSALGFHGEMGCLQG